MLVRNVLCFSLAILLTPITSSQASDDLSSSALKLAPEDSAFFMTSVNMDAAWEDLLEGNFVRRVRSVPFVQKVEAELQNQWDNPQPQVAQAKAVILSPSVQNVLRLASEMFSDEVFVYGGDDWCETMEFIAEFQTGFSYAMNRGPDGMEEFFDFEFPEIIDTLKIPTTVMGFRIKDSDNAQLQLDALEGLLRFGLGNVPEAEPFLRGLKRADFQEGQSLTFTLESSMFSPDTFDGNERAYDIVTSILSDRKISIGLGLKSDLLVMTVSGNEKLISEIGSAEGSLLDNGVMETLTEAAPTNLRSVSYASSSFRNAQWQANFDGYFGRLAGQMSALEQIPGMEDSDLLEQLEGDAEWMDEKLADNTPNFGAQLSWAHTTADRTGVLAYTYDWTEGSAFENAEPMTITQHAGSQPLAMFAFKQREIPIVKEFVEYALDKAPSRIMSAVRVNVNDEAQVAMIEQIVGRVMSIVNDAYRVMVDTIGPSMSDNESLLSIAGQWEVDYLGPGAPVPSRPLPLPEIAGAAKLSDREAFLAGGEEIFNILDRLVDVIREVNPNSVPPDYSIPRPTATETEFGTRFSYPQISGQVPLDGFDLQILLTDDAVLYGYSTRQIDDMAQAKKLASKPAWLGEDDAVAAVSFIDLAGMAAAVRPWIEFGFEVSGYGIDTPITFAPDFPLLTGNDVLQIWDCLESAGKAAGTVVVDEETGATITRSVWVAQ